ncbi:hypothetical protein JMUB6875_31870 [Nocardia sp. JMUB6875]|uniref:hypothetical protein n=1 Tax=Nocardia sp. JMUB6875 TaxID=3158170 RepID=UPI0032E618D7
MLRVESSNDPTTALRRWQTTDHRRHRHSGNLSQHDGVRGCPANLHGSCFSTKPLHVPTQQKQQLDFHCLPSQSSFTKQLEEEAKRTVLTQLAKKRVDLQLKCTADANAVPSCD